VGWVSTFYVRIQSSHTILEILGNKIMDQPSNYVESVTTSSTMGSSDGTGADSSSVISDEHLDRRRGAQSADDQLNKLALIPAHDSWHFDITELLDSQTYIPPARTGQKAGNNFKNYDPKKSIFVLCVIGSLDVHLHLLWYGRIVTL
jgi:hypothetical protein